MIFEIKDKTKRTIRLTLERWKHIQQEHPEINNIELLKETLSKPLIIKPSKYDPDHVCYYYSYDKQQKRYLMIAVKYLNGDGFIITTYYLRKLS